MSLTQKKRARMIANCYAKWNIHGKKVVDIGCGNGVVSEILKEKLNLDLCGADIIDYCKIKMPFRKIDKADRLPFDDLSFDYAMFNDVLHHIEDIEASIIEANRIARNILIFEDQPGRLLRVVDVALNYFYSPLMPRPLNFKNREQWCLLFDRLGFKYDIVEAVYPFWYPFRHMAFRLKKT